MVDTLYSRVSTKRVSTRNSTGACGYGGPPFACQAATRKGNPQKGHRSTRFCCSMDFMEVSVNLTEKPDGSVRKRVRTSKNRKKGWKKHSNIEDVEEFLEDQRLQERTGWAIMGLTEPLKPKSLLFLS